MTPFDIYPLRCGHILNHPITAFLYRQDRGGVRIEAPCTAWLLRSEHHTIMVDTGPGTRAAAPQHYRTTDPDDLLPLELARLGIDPNSIGIVVLTHLHNDHVGGAAHFPNAVFHVQEQELHEAVSPVPFQRAIYEVNQRGRNPPWVRILDRMEVLHGESNIVPGVSTVMLPGHTSGSQGVVVDTIAGRYVLPGDLVPLWENWPDDGSPPIPNGNHTDLYAYERSFRKLASLAATVLPSHDPRVFEHTCYPPPMSPNP